MLLVRLLWYICKLNRYVGLVDFNAKLCLKHLHCTLKVCLDVTKVIVIICSYLVQCFSLPEKVRVVHSSLILEIVLWSVYCHLLGRTCRHWTLQPMPFLVLLGLTCLQCCTRIWTRNKMDDKILFVYASAEGQKCRWTVLTIILYFLKMWFLTKSFTYMSNGRAASLKQIP